MNPEIDVVTFGIGSFLKGEIPQQTVHFGQINNNKDLCEIYNAADVFLGPSIAEAMGKTFLEAQLCGLPAVCFDNTGPVDIILHKKTGYISKFKDTDDLMEGLEFCFQSNMNRVVIRNRAVSLFDITVVSREYVNIYKKCICEYDRF